MPHNYHPAQDKMAEINTATTITLTGAVHFMASLQIPIASWKGSIDLNVTSTLCRPEVGWIFLGLASGHIVRLNANLKGQTLSLEMLLLGHQDRIVSMVCSSQRSDQQHNAPTVLLSLDRKGEIALWCVDDGRCLLHNVMAIDGEARGMCLSPCKEYVFVYGHSSVVNVIRVATLEVIQSVPLPSEMWTSCAAVLNDDHDQCQVIVFNVLSNSPAKFTFDKSTGRASSAATFLIMESTGNISECTRIGGRIFYTNGLSVFSMSAHSEETSIDLKKLWQTRENRIYRLFAVSDDGPLAVQLHSGELWIVNIDTGIADKLPNPNCNFPKSIRKGIEWNNQVYCIDFEKNQICIHDPVNGTSSHVSLVERI